MSIGLGIFLLVVGAILVWALDVTVTGVDLTLVGYILLAAGALVTILGLVLMTRRRNSVSTTRTIADPANGEQVTRRENSIDDL
jgi:membrane-bound ClpP family serine protease